MNRQTSVGYQLQINFEEPAAITPSEAVRQAEGSMESKAHIAIEQGRALISNLMEQVCSYANMHRAYLQVKRNKGVAGMDGMNIPTFKEWYIEHGKELLRQLANGEYKPDAIRRVEIPKPNGGMRKLGIPTVRDRVIQQAIAQVLMPIYDRTFSPNSYGFRPNKGAHDALRKGAEYVAQGYTTVVDIDLATFFDLVNHDRLMYRLSQRIGDKILLGLIRKYLQSGIMINGLCTPSKEGTPQGSPLSPLLSNIVLDELDKELEKRGHHFIRYADDCQIFVHSPRAGVRVMDSISNFIENTLKLKVNREKSRVCRSPQAKYLGYVIDYGGRLNLASKSLERLKDKIRKVTKRNRGRSFSQIIEGVNQVLRGWLNYFYLSRISRKTEELDGWIRRKLRCYRIKQCKRVFTLYKFLYQMGVSKTESWRLAKSGKGYWRKALSNQAHKAMGVEWFEEQGLYSLSLNHARLNR